jgi:hypothetical protein
MYLPMGSLLGEYMLLMGDSPISVRLAFGTGMSRYRRIRRYRGTPLSRGIPLSLSTPYYRGIPPYRAMPRYRGMPRHRGIHRYRGMPRYLCMLGYRSIHLISGYALTSEYTPVFWNALQHIGVSQYMGMHSTILG